MTISMTVILIESTNHISYGLPIMVIVMVSKWIGDFFNKGIYDLHIDFRDYPFLPRDARIWMRNFRAKDIMATPPMCFNEITKVEKVYSTLMECSHIGFPVISNDGYFTGLILRSQLTVLLNNKIFNSEAPNHVPKSIQMDDFRFMYPRFPEIEEVKLDEAELEMYLNIAPYMNARTVTVNQYSTLHRCFNLFRTLGLRHLVCVDDSNQVVGIITRKDFIRTTSKEKSKQIIRYL